MVLGCWSSRRPRKPWKPIIVRSPSPDCRCSCHRGVRAIPETHERSSMTALETSNALPRQNYTNNFNDNRSNRMLDVYSSQVNPSHTYGPVDGSLYATVAKSGGKKSPVTFALPNGAAVADNGSDEGRHTISIDSGISSTVSAHHIHSRNHNAHHRHNGTSSGFPSPMNVEVEVHDHCGHNARHTSKPTSEELAELDELLNGMLQQIESFPDFASTAPKSPIPVAKSQSSPVIPRYTTVPKATPPGSVSSRNSDYSYPRFIMSNGSQEHHQTRYLTRPLYNSSSDDRKPYPTGSQPFSYGVPANSPALQRRRVFSESTAYVKESTGQRQDDTDDVFSDYSSTYADIFGDFGDSSLTWLQRQQLKLRSKREGKGMHERQMKERQLLAELKSVAKRIPSESSSRESSPPYSQPLHINTTPMNGSSSLRAKPYPQTSSTPSTPSVPVRSTSRTIDTRSLDWDNNRRLQRQRSDNSYDRPERPFVAVKRAHEELRENMMSTGKTPQEIVTAYPKYGTVYPYGHHHVYMPDARDEPRQREGHRNGLLMQSAFDEVDAERPQHSTPYDKNTNAESNSWSPSYMNSSPAVSPTRYDRPTTPGFPTTPGTPYANTLSGSSPPYGKSTTSALPAQKSNSAYGDRVSGQSSPGGSVYMNQSQRSSLLSLNESEVITQHPFSVRDTSSYWYKPNISREEAINTLRNMPAGTFVVRDSNSFPGAFGLALKVATPPPNVHSKTGDISSELVRHFLIEPTSKGVRLKGCPNEPTFSSLSALVYQHSITAIALPCKLIIPECDPSGDVTKFAAINTLTDESPGSILSAGAACNVLYLVTVDMESLTGPQAVRKAINELMAMKPQPVPTVVHFKVSTKGITLTDNNHRLFFRRHYQLNMVSFCGIDPDFRKWNHKLDNKSTISCLLFGFVARKTGSKTDNQCHIFSEYDTEQPASAIVNFVNKVMAANPSQQHSRSNFL